MAFLEFSCLLAISSYFLFFWQFQNLLVKFLSNLSNFLIKSRWWSLLLFPGFNDFICRSSELNAEVESQKVDNKSNFQHFRSRNSASSFQFSVEIYDVSSSFTSITTTASHSTANLKTFYIMLFSNNFCCLNT